jgi:hypothetical protein
LSNGSRARPVTLLMPCVIGAEASLYGTLGMRAVTQRPAGVSSQP